MTAIVSDSGELMCAAVALLADDGTGTDAAAPPSFTVACTYKIGAFPAREYRRDDGALFVLQRIASGTVAGTKRWLVVVWTASTTRAAALSAFQALTDDLGANVINAWRVTQDATSGRLVSATLDTFLAGTGAVPTAIKAVWPAAWTADGAGAAPRFIGDVLA